MTGVERMERMYQGRPHGVPVALFFSSEYICHWGGVPDYRFLYGTQDHRAKAQVDTLRRHDVDAFYIWTRGKRHDWRRDYRLVEEGPRSTFGMRGIANWRYLRTTTPLTFPSSRPIAPPTCSTANRKR